MRSRFIPPSYRRDDIYDRGVAGHIDPVVLGKFNVAFRVTTPYSSLVKRNIYSNSLSGYYTSFLAKRRDARELKRKSPAERNAILASRGKEAVRTYGEDYRKAVEVAGWRVIESFNEEYFSPSYCPPYRSRDFQPRGYRSAFWVTKLSVEEWDAISLLISHDSIKREYEEFGF